MLRFLHEGDVCFHAVQLFQERLSCCGLFGKMWSGRKCRTRSRWLIPSRAARCVVPVATAPTPGTQGRALSPAYLQRRLGDYAGLLSCVLFFGGEWQTAALLECLRTARAAGLKTCLYTGLEEAPAALLPELTFVKTGAWRRDRGGLDCPDTNQRFIRTADGAVLNHLFWR